LSWGPNKVLRPLAAAALLAGASAATADILVVRSSGPSAKSYPPGRRLPESARLVLKGGDQLIVLDGRGTRIVRGPGTFAAGAPAVGRIASAPAADRRARIGAVRGLDTGELRPPSIWHVDVARSSNVCVADPAKVTLWRGDTARALTLNIGAAGGRTKALGWPPGSSTLAWPADLPVADGSEYRLSWSGGKAPTTIRFKTMPAKPAGLEDMAQTLIRNRCDAQLDLFIDTVKLPG
jgi:hypothetical protein